MVTCLKTIHEEQYSDGSKTLGILLNYNDNENFKESFAYIYNHERKMYIFFNTMMDMFDFLLYGDNKVKRAYMEEDDFDKYYDGDYFEGKFIEILIFV